MKQKLLWAILPAFCLLSCSKDDDKTDPEPETPATVTCVIAVCSDQNQYVDMEYEFSLGDKTVTVKASEMTDITSKAKTYCPNIKEAMDGALSLMSLGEKLPDPSYLEAKLGTVAKGTTIKGVKTIPTPKTSRPQTKEFYYYLMCVFTVNGEERLPNSSSAVIRNVVNDDQSISEGCVKTDFVSYTYK